MLRAPIFSYVRLRAGSVVAAAIRDGTLDASSGLAVMLLRGGDDLVTGVPGFLVLAVVNLGLALYDRRWAAQPVMMPGQRDA